MKEKNNRIQPKFLWWIPESGESLWWTRESDMEINKGIVWRMESFEDILDNLSGYYTNGGAQQRQKTTTGYEKDTHLRAAGNYVRNGYYQEARNVLDGMEPARRNARWYYYSAAANQGLGNNVTAMEHAKQAVSMEPDNYEYQMLLQQLQGNGSWYQQRQSTYQNPYSTGGDWCMKMCMLNLMCNCCLGGRYWC